MTGSPVVVHARAPLRVSFAGGGTDVPPYPDIAGGAVLSVTIDQYAYATLRPSDGAEIRLAAPDLVESSALAGRTDLARSAFVGSAHTGGAEVVLHCDAPPGSGLGSSSSLIVALCAAVCEVTGESLSPYELAARSWRIERVDLGIPGGMQDQYAAVFGGLNFIEFGASGSILVTPLRIRAETLAELHGSLLLVPTPKVARRSTGILGRQVAAYERAEPDVMAALGDLKAQAVEMKAALLRSDLVRMADLMHDGWLTKRRLADGIATPAIDELYEVARSLGATGGKLLGAGGGGFLLLMTGFERRGALRRALVDRGVATVPLSFVDHGAMAWRGRP